MSKAVARVVTWLRSRSSAEGGFTLVEIVISVSLLGLITGAATTSMITATNGARITSQRAHESTDAQLISAFLVRDAQAAGGSNPATGTVDSSLGVTLTPPLDLCTPAYTSVRFNWIDRGTPLTNKSAAYALDPATHLLTRRSCENGVSGGDMELGTRVASFVAVCNPSCPGLPNLVTVTVTELADPSYSQFSYDLVAQLRPEAQAAPSIYNSTPVPLLALGGGSCPTAHGAFIDLHGTSTLQVQLGGVIVNSYVSGCDAVNVGGSGTYAAGSTSVLDGNTCTVPGCTTYTQPIADPLAGLSPPGGTCGGVGDPPKSFGIYQPGVYNNAVTIPPSTTATFADGTYIFCNGLDVRGTVVAPHVLFYFAGGSLTVTSNGTMTIGSQISVPYSLVSIWQPHNDPLTINGGAGLDSYKGIIYAPLSVVHITGGTNLQIGSIIAYAIDLGGGGYVAFGPGVTIVTPSLPPAFVGVAYLPVTMSAAGGPPTPPGWPATPPRYRDWLATGLPIGLSIDPLSGVLSGTTTSPTGTYAVEISVTDYVPIIHVTTKRTYPLILASGSLSISSTSPLMQATANTNYSMTFQASGGNLGLTGAYQWTNTTPLPDGLSWTGNGVISGSPTTVGPTTLTIKVKDDANTVVSMTFALQVNPFPVITTGGALLSTKGATFSKPQTFTGGTTLFIGWGIRVGDSLPGGLSIDPSDGRIFGTPTTAGTTSFTIVLTDARGAQATKLFNMTVYDAPSITTASLPSWDAGTPYPSPTQLTSSGGSPPLNWSATGMPPGLTLSSSGAVLGKPTTAGNYSIVVTATDQSSVSSAPATFSVVIAAALAITTPTSLPNGELPLAYGPITATSTGGTGVKTWTATNMPPGVVISSGGVISGAPTTAGEYTPTITVQDAIGVIVSSLLPKMTVFPALSATFSDTFFNWDAGATNPNYTLPTPPQILPGSGSGVYMWSVAPLPAGLVLNASTGALTGTPSTAGTYGPITWTVSDSLGASISRIYGPVTINPALTITVSGSSIFPNWDSGVAYPTQTLTAGGGSAGTKTWAMSSGSLPSGMTFNASTGVVGGTPSLTGTAATSFTATFTLTDPTVGAAVSTTRMFTISPALTLTAPSPAPKSVWPAGIAYPPATFTTTGGTSPTWSITGLPAGMTFLNGVIAGTPTTQGSPVTVAVTVSDAARSLSSTYNLTINPPFTLTPPASPKTVWTAGTLYPMTTFSSSGGSSPTWSITGLPAGMTFSGGVIAGTPTTAAGAAIITVTISDSTGASLSSSYSLTINSAITATPAALPTGAFKVPYSATLSASGGTGGLTWALTSALPAGLVFDAPNHVISGTPTSTGSFIVSYTITDGTNVAKSFSASLIVNARSMTMSNGAGSVGTLDQGDVIVLSNVNGFQAASICNTPIVAGGASVKITMTLKNGLGSTNDSIAIAANGQACTPHLGSIDLGSNAFVGGDVALSVGNSATMALSLDGKSITLTIGKLGNGAIAQFGSLTTAPVLTPDGVLSDSSGSVIPAANTFIALMAPAGSTSFF